ncbi:hypothetical protein FJT64_010207 [Amphibalanus amphitrite]|uniref:Uncharacterized protein n=1 Tax=Amphibalanus amphitrite TaxID=1232801 RepID=A0A6A4VB20_AMPAM|nr:hypothetical protein FJT64_010207 [Amphibalanus amphitrite]
MEIDQSIFGAFIRVMVVAVNACRTAPEGSAGRLLSLLDQLRLPDAGALPDWGLHPGMLLGAARCQLRRWSAYRTCSFTCWDVSAENAHVYQYRLWDAKRVKVETAQNRVPAETLVGLQNLLVHLWDVSAENAHVYQYRLWDAKRVKVETAQNRGVSPDGAAGYRDGLRRATNGHPLSAEEVQKVVSRVPAETLVGLQNLLVHLRDVSAENAHVYQYRLWDAKRVKVETAQNRGVSPDGSVVVAVNACRTAPEGSAGRLLSLLDQLRLPDAGALPDWGLHPGMLLGAARCVPAETLVGLQNLLVHLWDVSAENAHVYQYRLWDAKRVKVETAQNRVCNTDRNTSRNAGRYTGRKID